MLIRAFAVFIGLILISAIGRADENQRSRPPVTNQFFLNGRYRNYLDQKRLVQSLLRGDFIQFSDGRKVEFLKLLNDDPGEVSWVMLVQDTEFGEVILKFPRAEVLAISALATDYIYASDFFRRTIRGYKYFFKSSDIPMVSHLIVDLKYYEYMITEYKSTYISLWHFKKNLFPEDQRSAAEEGLLTFAVKMKDWVRIADLTDLNIVWDGQTWLVADFLDTASSYHPFINTKKQLPFSLRGLPGGLQTRILAAVSEARQNTASVSLIKKTCHCLLTVGLRLQCVK